MVEQGNQPQGQDMFEKVGDIRLSKLSGLTEEERDNLKSVSIISAGMLFGQLSAGLDITARFLGVSERRAVELAELSFSALSPTMQERMGSDPIEREQYHFGALPPKPIPATNPNDSV